MPMMMAIQTKGTDRVVLANGYRYIDAQRVSVYLKALSDAVASAN